MEAAAGSLLTRCVCVCLFDLAIQKREDGRTTRAARDESESFFESSRVDSILLTRAAGE